MPRREPELVRINQADPIIAGIARPPHTVRRRLEVARAVRRLALVERALSALYEVARLAANASRPTLLEVANGVMTAFPPKLEALRRNWPDGALQKPKIIKDLLCLLFSERPIHAANQASRDGDELEARQSLLCVARRRSPR